MRKKITFLLFLGMIVNIHAITTPSRIKQMAVWGAAAAAGWYGWRIKDTSSFIPIEIRDFAQRDITWKSQAHKSAVYRSIIPGGAMAAFVGWITSYYTAQYRYKWAQAERVGLSKSVLFSYRITDENLTQISIASGAESTGLPLVTLFLGLSSIDTCIGNMIDELEIAAQEIKASSQLSIKIKTVLNDLYEDRVRVRENSHVVKNVDKYAWQKQWEMHNSNQMKEKEIAAIKEVASKPQVHFNHHSEGADGFVTTMLAHMFTR